MLDFAPALLALVVDTHSATQLPLTMLIVFASAKLLAELFEWLRQPALVGEILAGILIGPSVLNWVQPNELLTLLAELGVLFLLFRVGLEVKASELLAVGGTAMVVAVLGVVLPFLAGWGIMSAWGVSSIEAIFVGAAMVATSVGITAQVLAAKGLLSLAASRVILAAAVFDDILGLLVLALVSSMAQGNVHIPSLIATAGMAIGFTALVAKWGTRWMQHLVPRLESRLRAGEVQFNVALIVLFGLSVAAVYVGVAAIIGAFLAGMALAETVQHRVHDLAHGITELLLPFFLAGIGLHLDMAVFANIQTVLLALLILVAAVLSKLVGCGLGAIRMGRTEMLRVGVGMIPRGEVGMVVAQLGLGLGVIERPVYAVVVCMAIFTTVIAPPLLKIAYREAVPVLAEEQFELG